MRCHTILQLRIILAWSLMIVPVVSADLALAEKDESAPAEITGNGDMSTGTDEALPYYQGEGSFYLGFRAVNFDASSRSAEYEDGRSSVAMGIDGLACPLPHRYHMHLEYFGEHNNYADFGYAYKDFLLFRNILVGVHHNLNHYDYLYPGDPPAVVLEDRSPGDENYIDFFKNEFLFRAKAPDFPLHAFAKHRYVEREGILEERFLTGSIGNLIKTSESRDINWESKDLTLGMNSHLGPVEVEYAHNKSIFDPGAGSVLYDYFSSSTVFGRPGDTYPHNVIPETESSGNTLRFHSSYTGQVVASATLSNAENTNNYSGAESDAWKAAMDLRWIPDPVISLFFKYRHREQDKENPEQVTLVGDVNRITYPVRKPVSTRKDLFSLSARYRPLNRVTLVGNYEFENRERSDVDEWIVLPEDSDVHRVRLTAHARPLNTLKLKAVYDYHAYENPSYNTEPDHANKIRLNATYTPAGWITALFDYSLSLTQREDLHYLQSNQLLSPDEGERDGRTDRFLGNLSFVLSPEVSLTASWAYNRLKIEQDLAYALRNTTESGRDSPYYDRGVPYTDESNTFALSLYYLLRKDLTLTADLSYTIAEGEYLPGDVLAGNSSSLGSFSTMETTETIVTVGLARKLMEDWEVGVSFSADIFKDKFSDGTGDHRDGDLYITTFTVKRYF
ncbi:MAG TPA: hypothetical protein ENO11_04970 [Desulfobacteraceae bacterium]|nr:hypothetical protein [Desulfobacteraceae bacterium]